MDVPLPSPAFDLYHHDPIQEEEDATLTVDELADRIRRASVFSELDDADIRELAEAATPERFRRGETMLPPEIVSRELYVLWSGRARIMLAEVSDVFIELSDGDVFGVVSRSRDRAASQEVIAVTDCEVVRIDASTAGAIASRNPSLADELNQLLSSRNRRLDPLVETIQIEAPALEQGSVAMGEDVSVDEVDSGDEEPAS